MISARHKRWLIPAAIVLLALALRLPGLSQPYHQDEYKWALIVAKGSALAGSIPHPPLSELVFTATDRIFGNTHLRMLPFLLSFANLLLLALIMRRRYGRRAAVIASVLYAVSFYSVLASLMVDNDGQTLPLLFLAGVYCYDRLCDAVKRPELIRWAACFAVVCVAGFLTKLSFVIPAGAFAIDALIRFRHRVDWRLVLRVGVAAAGCVAVLAILLWNAHYLFSSFDIRTPASYMLRFFDLRHRQWLQVLIQFFKSVMYLSPLLLAPLFLMDKRLVAQMRLFIIFAMLAVLFYFVLFDFSGGALDRYCQVFIVPLVAIAGVVYAGFMDEAKLTRRGKLFVAAGIAVALTLVQLLPHVIPALHPKTEWASRMLSLQWNFLFPFSGGSGPLGFYVSFLFIGTAFVVSAVSVALIRTSRTSIRTFAVLVIGAVGLAYNAAFVEEYLFGMINGYAPSVLRQSIAYLAKHPEIDKVITFNDTGAYELLQMGKYQRRLYIDPLFDAGNIKKLNENKGYYLIVGIPRIDPQSEYAAYFSSCQPVFQTVSGQINGTIVDCRNAKDIR